MYVLFSLCGYGFCHNFLKLFHNHFVDFHFAGVILVVNFFHSVFLALYLNELINLLRFSNPFAILNNFTTGDALSVTKFLLSIENIKSISLPMHSSVFYKIDMRGWFL